MLDGKGRNRQRGVVAGTTLSWTIKKDSIPVSYRIEGEIFVLWKFLWFPTVVGNFNL